MRNSRKVPPRLEQEGSNQCYLKQVRRYCLSCELQNYVISCSRYPPQMPIKLIRPGGKEDWAIVRSPIELRPFTGIVRWLISADGGNHCETGCLSTSFGISIRGCAFHSVAVHCHHPVCSTTEETLSQRRRMHWEESRLSVSAPQR